MSYPAKRQTAEERREYARLAREESRAKALGRAYGSVDEIDQPDPETKILDGPPMVVTEKAESGGYVFEVVDELPKSNRPSLKQNPARAAVSAQARANKGKWLKYVPNPADPYKSASNIGAQARKGAGGFGPGLDATVRQGALYICYIGEAR